MNAPAKKRYWSFPTYIFRELTEFMLVCWVPFMIVAMGIIYAIDRWGELRESIWEDVVQVPQWFVLFMGVQVAMVYLPMNITHGKTRRDTTIEAGLFVVAYSALAALLVTIGWVIERAMFSLLDVEQILTDPHIFSSATDYPLIFLESWINLALWTAGGLFIAASYYRYDSSGLIAIVPSLLIASFVALFLGSSWGPASRVLDNLFDVENPPVLLSAAVGVACVALMLILAWKVIQEMPIRKYSS